MRDTSKKIFAVLGFLLVIFSGDRIIALVLDKISLLSNFRFSMVYQGGQDKDLIIIGDSRGVNSFYAPEIEKMTGMRVLNLSYNGAWGELGELLLLDYLERNRKPKLLIVEITSFAKPRGKLINDLKLYASHSRRLQIIGPQIAPDVFYWSNVSHLYRYNSEIFFRVLYYLNKSDQSWVNRYKISPGLLQHVAESPDESMAMIPENINALKRIVDRATKLGIDVRLVVGPYLPAYVSKIPNLDIWVSKIQKLVGPDYPIWNFSTSIEYSDFFADRVHLNYEGSHALLVGLVKKDFFRIKEH